MYVDSRLKVYSPLMDLRDLYWIVLNEGKFLFTHVDTTNGTNGSKLEKYTKHREYMDNEEETLSWIQVGRSSW